jgi:Pre-toxin TG
MSTSTIVPMIGPNGEVGDVPYSRIDDAVKAGFQRAVEVQHPGTGERGVIPLARYPDALNGGMVPYSPSSVPVPAELQGSPAKSMAQRSLDMLNYPLMSKLSPTYQQDRQTDETLAHGPTTPYEQEHPALGYVRRKLAQGALMAEDAITPGTVATAGLGGTVRMLGGVAGAAGRVAQGAQIANKALSGVYGAQSLKSGYDAATNDKLSAVDRLTGAGMGLVGGALGAVDVGAGKPAAAPLQASAEKTYSRFLNPTRVDTKAMAQDVIPALLEKHQMATSLGSLSDVATGKLRDLGQQIDNHAAAIPGDVRPDMSRILGDMRDYQNGFSVGGNIVNPVGHGHAQQVIDTLNQFGDGTSPIQGLNANPSFQDMRNVRQILDKPVAEAGAYAGRTVADQSLLNAQKAGANSIRAELARQSPELDALNGQYNFWSKVKDIADASADRKVGQKGLFRAILPTIAASAGFAHGGVTGGLESLVPAAAVAGYTTPLVQTARANVKGALGRALARGNVSNDTRLLQRGLAANAYDDAH